MFCGDLRDFGSTGIGDSTLMVDGWARFAKKASNTYGERAAKKAGRAALATNLFTMAIVGGDWLEGAC